MIVEKGSTLVSLTNVRLLARVEVWDAVFGEKGHRKVGNLVPMHAEHFAQCKATGAFQKDAKGTPIYFTRTETGIEIHPACTKDYWLEPVFRKPIPVTAGSVGDNGSLQAPKQATP